MRTKRQTAEIGSGGRLAPILNPLLITWLLFSHLSSEPVEYRQDWINKFELQFWLCGSELKRNVGLSMASSVPSFNSTRLCTYILRNMWCIKIASELHNACTLFSSVYSFLFHCTKRYISIVNSESKVLSLRIGLSTIICPAEIADKAVCKLPH